MVAHLILNGIVHGFFRYQVERTINLLVFDLTNFVKATSNNLIRKDFIVVEDSKFYIFIQYGVAVILTRSKLNHKLESLVIPRLQLISNSRGFKKLASKFYLNEGIKKIENLNIFQPNRSAYLDCHQVNVFFNLCNSWLSQ